MEMSTEEMLWAGLQAGPVHVLQNTAEGGKRVRPRAMVKATTERLVHQHPGAWQHPRQ